MIIIKISITRSLHLSPGVCRTGVLSFLRVLPPLLLSAAGGGVTFSGAGGVEADTEL